MNKLYPLQLWAATLLIIGPVLGLLFSYTDQTVLNNDSLQVDLWFIPFSLFFSLPTLLVIYFLFLVLIRLRFLPIQIKWLINLTTVTGIWITLKLLGGTMNNMLASGLFRCRYHRL